MQLGYLRDWRGHYSSSSGVQPRRPKGIREAPLCSSFRETQGSSSSSRKILIHPGALAPLPKSVYLHYLFDLWADVWRKKVAKGDMVVVRYAGGTPVQTST